MKTFTPLLAALCALGLASAAGGAAGPTDWKVVQYFDVSRSALQLELLVGEREIHQRLLGSPSTRSATMLRKTSDVPASIVLPRLRSCW